MNRRSDQNSTTDSAPGGWPSWPWLLRVGRWQGEPWTVDLRFLAAVVVAWGCVWVFSIKAGTRDLTLLAGMAIGVGIISVILHEAAKSIARFILRVQPQEIVLGPLGNLVENIGTQEPRKDIWATSAGILFSTLLSITTAVILAACHSLGPTVWLGPLPVPYLDGYSGLVSLGRLTMWINGLLAVINLLPIGPLAGRTILIAIFRLVGENYSSTVGPVSFSEKALLASDTDLLTAAERASRAALAISSALASFALAMALYAPPKDELIPGWSIPAVLSLLVFFAAMRDRYALRLGVNVDRLPSASRSQARSNRPALWEEPDMLSPGYLSSSADDDLSLSDQLMQRLSSDTDPFDSGVDDSSDADTFRETDSGSVHSAGHRSSETWIEGSTSATNPHRLDEILQKLHDGGMEGLSESEKTELERASRVLRERRATDPKKGLK